jgi:hypothetical protein
MIDIATSKMQFSGVGASRSYVSRTRDDVRHAASIR